MEKMERISRKKGAILSEFLSVSTVAHLLLSMGQIYAGGVTSTKLWWKASLIIANVESIVRTYDWPASSTVKSSKDIW